MAADPMLGLPPVPVPAGNPVTPAKVALGHKLFMEMRFSSTGTVGCSTCHDPAKAFTDSPRMTSQGVNKLTGTRNAPTVINSAYFTTLFWDGREPSLELQSKDPMVNPVEMGLKDHQPVLKLVRSDPQYVKMFKAAFGIAPAQITMTQVEQAIGTFERTVVAGDSPFDRWFYGHDDKAMTASARRGYEVFIGQGAACPVTPLVRPARPSPTTASTTSVWALTPCRKTHRRWCASSSTTRRMTSTSTRRCCPIPRPRRWAVSR
jgi:Cytochrome c peroxidase